MLFFSLEVTCNLALMIGILQLFLSLQSFHLNVCHQRKEVYDEHCRKCSKDSAQLANLRVPYSKANGWNKESKVKGECLW